MSDENQTHQSGPSILDTIDDPSVTDPLSEVTRRERRALLGSSVVGLAISAGGLVPEKIETFGISVTPQQEESLLFILGGVIGYFWIAFAIYAWSDVKRRETVAAKAGARVNPKVRESVNAFKEVQEKLKKTRIDQNASSLAFDPQFMELARMSDEAKFAKKVQRVGRVRVAFGAYFPLVAGLTSIMVVWSSTGEFPGWYWVGIGAGGATILIGLIALIRSWSKVRHSFRKWKSKRRSARQKRLAEEAKKLPEGDPRREELLKEVRELLMKNVEDLKNGIY